MNPLIQLFYSDEKSSIQEYKDKRPEAIFKIQLNLDSVKIHSNELDLEQFSRPFAIILWLILITHTKCKPSDRPWIIFTTIRSAPETEVKFSEVMHD